MKVWETETLYLHGSLCIGYDQTEKINWDLDVVVRLFILKNSHTTGSRVKMTNSLCLR